MIVVDEKYNWSPETTRSRQFIWCWYKDYVRPRGERIMQVSLSATWSFVLYFFVNIQFHLQKMICLIFYGFYAWVAFLSLRNWVHCSLDICSRTKNWSCKNPIWTLAMRSKSVPRVRSLSSWLLVRARWDIRLRNKDPPSCIRERKSNFKAVIWARLQLSLGTFLLLSV